MASVALVLLGGCGGGGGGGGGVFLPTAVSSVTLSGTATYDSVPNETGALVYAATTSKPIRGAAVDVLSGLTLVASTTTDANGAYSVTVPPSTGLIVRVKAQMSQSGAGPSWDVTVRDNTNSNAIYAMETPAFSSGIAASLTRDIHAPSGWGGSSYGSARVAGPFALLDTVYTAQAKVLSVAPSTAFPSLRVFWSVNNVPGGSNPAVGQIGTTFFSNASDGRAIYVLGKEGVDTDEYDASVIAHEWGHYYQSAFSRDDSPGGSHSMNDLLDRRVAFSEGWGNAWSGIALERSNYTDSVGAGQASGSNVNLAAGFSSGAGWYREASIHSILWNLNSQIGFKAIHNTMTGSFKSGTAVTSIHPFAAAFYAVAPANASNLNALLSGQSISPVADPFGGSETNSGGVSTALPMYNQATPGASNSACVINQAGTGNKLGNFAYLRFTVPTGGNYTIAVTGTSATDPDFVVYHGGQIAASDGLGSSETAVVALPAGESVLVITDFNNTSQSTAASPSAQTPTCFTVTIQ
ncbi:hypothetical protein [Variovorax sp. YR216]|uniref:hypothetical protein n=1 Tax=Variovorax sp. YR216 TaxID=1882828 RepID=UPI00210C83EA|nr:hypothetical protein [Variovorax sp. YR216]